MSANNESYEAPKPPSIPTVGEKLDDMDDWVPSENPHEGNYLDFGHGEVDCGDPDCPTCG